MHPFCNLAQWNSTNEQIDYTYWQVIQEKYLISQHVDVN